ncbi:hypothetical protein TCAP_02157 [Tolypocladium capitatum]|uniref:Uncharacterized protein n=1 Tax=Tolypocladium capitatum TaxID=45235 RepID=A0A2K3QK32_9HYPO|nr:hypothetical protein TCAP_02157 [Tolypocladium capitatum]
MASAPSATRTCARRRSSASATSAASATTRTSASSAAARASPTPSTASSARALKRTATAAPRLSIWAARGRTYSTKRKRIGRPTTSHGVPWVGPRVVVKQVLPRLLVSVSCYEGSAFDGVFWDRAQRVVMSGCRSVRLG